jgi:mono/diheme cytochrome c family protein
MPAIPNFRDPSWQESRSTVQLTISILEGKSLQMPPNRGPVTDQQAADLAAYVRTFVPRAQPAVVPSPVAHAPSSPAPVAHAPGSPAPVETAWRTGDFDGDINKLRKEWDDLQKQLDELDRPERGGRTSRVPVAPAPSVPAAPAATVAVSPASKPRQEQPPVAPPTITDRIFTSIDSARGSDLFAGRRRLVNGGPACITCHAAYGSGGPEGGRLGPELTKVFERLGGRAALSGYLTAAPTPPMHPVYREQALEEEEVLALVAYLEEADRQGVEQASGLPPYFFLLGLGGSVLGLAFVSVLWGGIFRPWRGRPVLNGGAAATTLPESELPSPKASPVVAAPPTARPDVAEDAERYVGLGV